MPKTKKGGKAGYASKGSVANKNLGKLRAKPGANPVMSRSAAMGGKTPDAQTSKPKRTHKIRKATK